MSKVALIMGSDSDLPKMAGAINTLKRFGVETEVRIISAHRAPDKLAEYVANAESNGIEVIIGAAGMAAHLPGVIAAQTTLPVIGVPIKSSSLEGLDALLSMVQMPPGIPVATVAIDGGDNAAILAIRILALKYPEQARMLKAFKAELAEKVDIKDQKVRAEYL